MPCAGPPRAFMARPRQPRIDRRSVVEKALEIIDRDGLGAVSIRRIGRELSVDGTSLYHHFADKEAILHGVRLRIMQESRVGEPARRSESWQDYVRRTASGYRRSLLRHPNAAPLLAPTLLLRPFSLRFRDRVATKLLDDGVPEALVFPIIDSVEILAYASALLDPRQEGARSRLTILAGDDVPDLDRAVRAAPRSANRVFDLQLQAVIRGWTSMLGSEAGRASP
jgi:TetR/AcrR family transcriptional regulator, tetracycline repressor protein